MDLSQQQKQQLVMTREMQQALQILQMPVTDLATLIAQQLEQNPLLEIEEPEGDWEEELTLETIDEAFDDHFEQSESFHRNDPFELQVADPVTLVDALMEQAHQAGLDPDLAEAIIGNLDERGFLTTPLVEIGDPDRLGPVLHAIQTFAPAGIAARTLQESLLIQLQQLGKASSPIYQTVESRFEELMAGQLPEEAAQISMLNFHPGTAYDHDPNPVIYPDVVVREWGGDLEVALNSDALPTLRFNSRLMRMLRENPPPDVLAYLKEQWGSGRWLIRNLYQRGETLQRVTSVLAQVQGEYLKGAGRLEPLTMGEVASRLGLHESTIARAVANKFLSAPRGTVSMRSLFTGAYRTTGGRTFSRDAAQQLVAETIASEETPLSDKQIAQQLQKRGIQIARRTVAKYRQKLGLGNRAERRRMQPPL